MSYGYEERLEGAFRLRRIRRIKTLAHVVIAALAMLLAAVQVLVRQPTLRPFYMPIESIVSTALLTAFVASLLGILFRHLEIKNAPSDGKRFLMIQNSMHQSLATIAVMGTLLAVLLLPAVHGAVAAGMSETLDRTITRGGSFNLDGGLASVDPLGLSRATAVRVVAVAGPVVVKIQRTGQIVLNTTVMPGDPLSIPLDTSTLVVYDIVISNPLLANAQFSLTIARDLFPELFTVVPLALGLFVAANTGWYWRLRPLSARYREASIYSGDYEDTVDPGERLFEESPNPYPTTTPFLNLPPPPPTELRAADSSPAGPVILQNVTASERRPAPSHVAGDAAAAQSADALLGEASRLEAAEDFDQALARYDAILRRAPRNRAAAIGKAGVLQSLGRRPSALGVYRQILREDRNDLDALRGCLAIHEAEAAWRDALDVADRIAELTPDDADAHAGRGDILAALKRPNEARGAYGRALALRPGDTDLQARADRVTVDIPLLQARAFVASASGDFEAAVAAFDEVLRREPDNLNARVGKSAALRRLGRVDEARGLVEDVLARNPAHSGALLTKAQMLGEAGDCEGSLTALEALLAGHPEDPDALLERGDVLARMGRADAAQASYEAALKLNPDDLDAAEKLKALAEGEKSHRGMLRELFRIRGLGPAKAKALIASGFRTREDFRRATVEQLEKVEGISRKRAEDILKHFSG